MEIAVFSIFRQSSWPLKTIILVAAPSGSPLACYTMGGSDDDPAGDEAAAAQPLHLIERPAGAVSAPERPVSQAGLQHG